MKRLIGACNGEVQPGAAGSCSVRYAKFVGQFAAFLMYGFGNGAMVWDLVGVLSIAPPSMPTPVKSGAIPPRQSTPRRDGRVRHKTLPAVQAVRVFLQPGVH